MRESCKSGSVGGLGGSPPRSTRLRLNSVAREPSAAPRLPFWRDRSHNPTQPEMRSRVRMSAPLRKAARITAERCSHQLVLLPV